MDSTLSYTPRREDDLRTDTPDTILSNDLGSEAHTDYSARSQQAYYYRKQTSVRFGEENVFFSSDFLLPRIQRPYTAPGGRVVRPFIYPGDPFEVCRYCPRITLHLIEKLLQPSQKEITIDMKPKSAYSVYALPTTPSRRSNRPRTSTAPGLGLIDEDQLLTPGSARRTPTTPSMDGNSNQRTSSITGRPISRSSSTRPMSTASSTRSASLTRSSSSSRVPKPPTTKAARNGSSQKQRPSSNHRKLKDQQRKEDLSYTDKLFINVPLETQKQTGSRSTGENKNRMD